MNDVIVSDMYEFILWNNCRNNCRFCWQKQHYDVSVPEDKILAIEKSLDIIRSTRFRDGSHVLFVGGEIFERQEQCVKMRFIQVVSEITEMMKTRKVGLFYVNTNLLNTDNEFLFEFLDIFQKKNLIERLKFTTSYDKYGRFCSDYAEALWRVEMKEVKREFPECNVVINTILTKQFCEFDLGLDVCTVKQFMDEFGCYTNLLPYVDVNGEYTPERNEVFRTLKNTDRQIEYLNGYISNFDLPQKKIIYRFVNGNYEYSSAPTGECGHSENFRRYSRRGSCFICDLKELFNA